MRSVARRAFLSAVGLASVLAFAGSPRNGRGADAPAAAQAPSRVPAVSPFIDMHTHLEPGDPARGVEAALRAMPAENALKLVFLPPPFTADDPERYDADRLLRAIRGHRERFAVLGGGGVLNPIIHEAVRTGLVDAAVRAKFRERAEQLLRDGAAGFGEIALEHFQGATPYQSAPPDHPLLLLLAEIAAEHGVPIVVHMEAVPTAMALPADPRSPPRLAQLEPNLAAFERLLAHDRRARIVWAHAGWDNSGHRTPALCRRLLEAHPNLFMDVKIDPAHPGRNPPLGPGATMDAEWLRLLGDFSDRFVVGTDQHYPEPSVATQRWQAIVAFLNRLPDDLRRKIGTENAARLLSPSARGSR